MSYIKKTNPNLATAIQRDIKGRTVGRFGIPWRFNYLPTSSRHRDINVVNVGHAMIL